MRLGDESIQLTAHKEITSLGRLDQNTVLPARQAVLCRLKMHQGLPPLVKGQMYEISDLTNGVLSAEPGIEGL